MKWSNLSFDGETVEARSSHTLTAVQDLLYVLGGERTPRLPLPVDVYCCDLKEQSCKQLRVSGDRPGPRLGHSTTAIKHTLYMFGGRTGAELADCTMGDLHAFDTQKVEWSEIQSAGSPEPRSFHAAASDGSNLYIFGGCGQEGRLNDLHRYDSTSCTWESLPSNTSIQASCCSMSCLACLQSLPCPYSLLLCCCLLSPVQVLLLKAQNATR